MFAGFFFSAFPDFACNRVAQLFVKMADDADGAANDGQPPAQLPGNLQFARQCADGASGIDRQLAWFVESPLGSRGDQLSY